MKISCFLTSFNRPTLVRRAIASVAAQTWRDFELFVLDESDAFDIVPVVRVAGLPPSAVSVHTWKRTPQERAERNPMSWKLNQILPAATGDVIVYLCDDDHFYPGWFEAVALHFMGNEDRRMAYGRLCHEKYGWRFPGFNIHDPLRVLDHCQVAHRRLDPPALWPEGMDRETATAPDGYYFREVRDRLGVYTIDLIRANAVVKGHHEKTWLKTLGKGPIEGLREG